MKNILNINCVCSTLRLVKAQFDLIEIMAAGIIFNMMVTRDGFFNIITAEGQLSQCSIYKYKATFT